MTDSIKERIKEVFHESKEILALITNDIYDYPDKFIYKLLLESIQNPIDITIGLKIRKENLNDCKRLMEKGIKIYHWNISEEMPLGLYISDRKYTLITFIGDWKEFPKHNVWIGHIGDAMRHKGFKFLIQWSFSFCCIPASERIKELEN